MKKEAFIKNGIVTQVVTHPGKKDPGFPAEYTVVDITNSDVEAGMVYDAAAGTFASAPPTAESVRKERDILLSATDMYALQDLVMTDAMATYRQALRDITEQDGFPTNITWPTKPEGA